MLRLNLLRLSGNITLKGSTKTLLLTNNMKTTKEIKELLIKAEQGNTEALKEVIKDTEEKLNYIDELDKQRKNKA